MAHRLCQSIWACPRAVQCQQCVLCFVVQCLFFLSFGLGPTLHTCSELCHVVPKKKVQHAFFFNFLKGHAKLSTYFFQVYVLFLESIVCLVKFNIIKSPKLKFVSNNNKLIIIRVCNTNY